MAATTTRPTSLRLVDYVNLSVLGFGLAALSTSLGQIILPMRVLDLAPESLKNTYLGILTFVGMATAMLVQPAVGYLSDRTNLSWGRRRPYVAAGGLLAVLLMAGLGLAGSYAWLVVAAVLVQLSANVAQSPYDAMVKDQVPQELRGRVVSTRAVAGAGGAVVFVLLTGLLMDHHAVKERDTWLWLALALPTGMLAGTMLWTVLSVKDAPPSNETGETPAEKRDSKAHPQLPWILAAGFFFTLAGGILQTYTLFFLRDVVELENPASAVGILAVVVGLTVLLSLYPAGMLADRIGRRPLLLFSAVLGSIGALLFFFATNLTHVILIGVPLGLAVGIFMTAGRAMITDMVSARWPALQLGIANLVLLGGLAVAKLGGIAIDVLNRQGEDLGYYVLLGICAASFLVGAVLVSVIRVSTGPTMEEVGAQPGD